MIIKINEKDFETEVLKAIARERLRVLPVLQKELVDLVSASPTYNSLIGGDLKELLALDDQAKFIPEWVAEQVYFLPNSRTLLQFLDESYPSLFSRPWASYVTFNGKVVDWLQHLLLSGTTPLFVKGRLVRTRGGVILTKDKNNLAIPPEDSGSAGNNFITRACQPILDRLVGLL